MKFLAFIFSFLMVSTAFSNDNNEEKEPKIFSISGKVTDASEELTGVQILLDGKATTVYTDFEGNFTLTNVLAGEHTVTFSLVAYSNKEILFNPKNGKSLSVELTSK